MATKKYVLRGRIFFFFSCVYVDWHRTIMLCWNWATLAFPHATFGNMPVYSTWTYVDSNMESTAMLFFDVFRTLERGAISTVGLTGRGCGMWLTPGLPWPQMAPANLVLRACIWAAHLWSPWSATSAEQNKTRQIPETHTHSAVFMILYTQFMNYPLLKNIHQKCVRACVVCVYFWAMDSAWSVCLE